MTKADTATPHGLTDERIRELARKWLEDALHDEYETLLVRGTIKTPDQLRTREEQAAHLYGTLMEAKDRKDYTHTIDTAREVLRQAGFLPEADEAGDAAPPYRHSKARSTSVTHHPSEKQSSCPRIDPRASGDANTTDGDSQPPVSRLQLLKLCDALLLAQAAVIESASSPVFAGKLTARPDYRLSAVRAIMDDGWNTPPTPPAPAQAPALSPAQSVTLAEAVEAYITAKDPTLSEVSKRSIYAHVRQFSQVIAETNDGRDISLAELDRGKVREYCRVIAAQPLNPRRKEYRDKPHLELAGLDLPAEQRLSAKTLSNKFITVQSLMNWFEPEYGIAAKPLNKAFEIPKGQGKPLPSRRGFNTEELRQVFNPRPYLSETKKSPARFWAPLLSLFTGMRLEEIAQLHTEDIRQDEGIWCIDVNEVGDGKHVKTEAGKRLVPLHPFLLDELGFLLFVERQREAGHERLFHALERDKKGNVGAPVGSWFTRYRRKIGIGGSEGEASGVVFHSFRHTVIHHLLTKARVNERLVQKVVGHDQKAADIGATAIYEGKYPTATLRDEVIAVLPWDSEVPSLASLKASPWVVAGDGRK